MCAICGDGGEFSFIFCDFDYYSFFFPDICVAVSGMKALSSFGIYEYVCDVGGVSGEYVYYAAFVCMVITWKT